MVDLKNLKKIGWKFEMREPFRDEIALQQFNVIEIIHSMKVTAPSGKRRTLLYRERIFPCGAEALPVYDEKTFERVAFEKKPIEPLPERINDSLEETILFYADFSQKAIEENFSKSDAETLKGIERE